MTTIVIIKKKHQSLPVPLTKMSIVNLPVPSVEVRFMVLLLTNKSVWLRTWKELWLNVDGDPSAMR